MRKTVLITGSSTGIGKSTAEYFQEKGWNVAATMRNPANGKELEKVDGVKVFQLDVTDILSIQKCFGLVMQEFGSIDVLVNNAGYGAVGAFEAASEEQIQKQFNTNVYGVFNTTHAILPHFRFKKSGTIINITSMGGRFTFPLYSLYHGTKWALEGFSESLQFELNQFNIKVKIVEPGAIKTDFYDRSMDVLQKPGLDAYYNYEQLTLPNMQRTGANAPGPEIVAKKIFQAATDSSNKLRYPVGQGVNFLIFLRWILPVTWFTKIVRVVVEKKSL